MSNVTFAPVVAGEFDASVRSIQARARRRFSRVRGVLAGLAFIGARVPFYVGAALLGAAACVIGITLFAMQAALSHAVGNSGGSESRRTAVHTPVGSRHA